jgi:putative peptidoglycan lipid II flippase
MASTILSAVLGLVRQMILADFGGTSDAMDAYVNAFALPEIINHVLAGSFLTITFIPIFSRYLVDRDMQSCSRLFSNIFTVTTVIMLVTVALSIFFAEPLIRITNPGTKDPGKFSLTVLLVRIILPAQIFFFWGSLLKAVQYAHKRFLLPSLSGALYNAGIICGGVFIAPLIGVQGFCWGVLIGAFAGNVLVQIPGLLNTGLVFRPRFDLRDPDLRKYIFLTIPLVLGIGMTFSTEFFIPFFGSLLGEGGSSSLNFAFRTKMFPVHLFGSAVAVAMFPFLTDAAVNKDFAKMNEIINSVISRIGAAIIPLSIVMMAVAPEIISLLYERGSFTAQSTARTSPILVIYLIGAFALCAQFIVLRSYYACQRTWFAALYGTGAVIVSLPIFWILLKHMGTQGIALATSGSIILQFGVLYTLWSRWTGNKGVQHVLVVLVKVIIAGFAGGAAAYCVKGLLLGAVAPSGLLRNVIILAGAGSSGLIVSAAGCYILRVRELSQVIREIFNKISGK